MGKAYGSARLWGMGVMISKLKTEGVGVNVVDGRWSRWRVSRGKPLEVRIFRN